MAKKQKKKTRQPVKRQVVKKKGKTTLSRDSRKKTTPAPKGKIKPKIKPSPKKGTKPSKGKLKRPQPKKKVSRNQKRYRDVQRLLSKLGKERGIKFGTQFGSQASVIFKGTRTEPLSYLQKDLAQIYLKYFPPSKVKTDFPDNFPYYDVSEQLMNNPLLEDVRVTIHFVDDEDNGVNTGDADGMAEWFRTNIHPICRRKYDKSPVATFNIIQTDNKTYVSYIIKNTNLPKDALPPGVELPEKEKPKEKPKEEKKEAPPAEKPPVSAAPEIDKQIELEKQKQKTIEMDIQKAQEQNKGLQMQNQNIELTTKQQAEEIKNLQARAQIISDLLGKGIGIEDIKKLLGI